MTNAMNLHVRYYGSGEYQASEAHYFMTPKGQKRDGSLTGVLLCHGHNDTALIPTATNDWLKIPRRLVEAGLPVMAADLGGIATWGNDTAQTRVATAFSFMQTSLGVRSDRLLLLGMSMGHQLAANFALNNLAVVKAIGGVFPVVNLPNMRGSYGTEIDTAYTDNAGYTAALPTHNPDQYAASLSTPSYLLYSTGDTVVLPADVVSYEAALPSGQLATIASAGAHATATITDAEITGLVNFLVGKA